jgi:hypothetical protein
VCEFVAVGAVDVPADLLAGDLLEDVVAAGVEEVADVVDFVFEQDVSGARVGFEDFAAGLAGLQHLGDAVELAD